MLGFRRLRFVVCCTFDKDLLIKCKLKSKKNRRCAKKREREREGVVVSLFDVGCHRQSDISMLECEIVKLSPAFVRRVVQNCASIYVRICGRRSLCAQTIYTQRATARLPAQTGRYYLSPSIIFIFFYLFNYFFIQI